MLYDDHIKERKTDVGMQHAWQMHTEYLLESLNINEDFLGDINVDDVNVQPIFIRFSASLLWIHQYIIQVPPKSRIFWMVYWMIVSFHGFVLFSYKLYKRHDKWRRYSKNGIAPFVIKVGGGLYSHMGRFFRVA